MREIKFRGWSLTDNIWVYGSLNSYLDGKTIITNIEGSRSWFVNHETIGQLTGLKDKNKVDIYEGDIVCYSGEVYIIVFQDYAWMLEKVVSKDFQFDSIFQTHWSVTHNTGFLSEIIGNIHQNKELI